MIIGEYELESPLINGGGLVKTVEDARLMARTAVGAVLGGSFTLDDRTGNGPNEEVIYYHDLLTQITYNSLGMPGKGIRTIAPSGELQQMIDITHDAGKPFILNFAPVSDVPVEEIRVMGQELEKAGIKELDGLEVNAACPNVIVDGGERHEILSHHPQPLAETLFEAKDVSANIIPLGLVTVRIAPFIDKDGALVMAAVLEDTGTPAVAAFNTFAGGIPKDDKGNNILEVPGGMGGMSGLGMANKAEERTRWLIEARDEVDGNFMIIGSNGVGNGETMKRRLDLGASAVSATTIFYNANNWGDAANKILQEYTEALENIDK